MQVLLWLGFIIFDLIVMAIVLSYVAPLALMRGARSLGFALNGFTRKRVQAGGVDFSYCEAGRGDTVLLLHGFGAAKDTWLNYARTLTPKYRVVIPDLPGFGESAFDPALRYGYAEQVARLHAFVEALGLPKLHLAGNSMGGAIAGVYAATYPSKIHTLLLMDCGGVEMPHPSDFWKMVDAGENALIVKKLEDVDTLFDYCFVHKPPLPGLAKRVFTADCVPRVVSNEKVFADILADGQALEACLAKIETPTLIMWGAQDRVLDRSIVGVLEQHLKNHETVVYEACGHLPYMEAPQKSARDHLKFIKAQQRDAS
jgi:pimeloyl-ACP methyl ester carboxylesterase